jgi:hypothetical protein
MSQAFYISDNRNYPKAIRFVDASGIISTPTITSADSLFTSNGGISGPWGIALSPDGSKLYVIDEASVPECVYSVDTTTFVATRIAGGGGAGALGWSFGDIYSIATDSQGNVYVGDTSFQITCQNMQATTHTILGVSIPAGGIAIVAGGNGEGFSGDGGPAIAAQTSPCYGLCVDSAGNLLFCDQLNHRIRRVDHATGIITTVVGSGAFFPALGGYTGDGGSPTAATLSNPLGVAVDPAGNFYITDLLNQVIRVVNNQATTQTLLGTSIAAHTIQTVAGPVALTTNKMWFCAIDTGGNLAFCNAGGAPGTTLANVWEVNGAGSIVAIAGVGGNWGTATGDGGPATSAVLGEAFGLAFVPAPLTGNIVVQKSTVPSGDHTLFNFHSSFGADFSLSDGETHDSGPLAVGTYSVSEDAIDGWHTPVIVVSNGSPIGAITVAAGETVLVTFENDRCTCQDYTENTVRDQFEADQVLAGGADGNLYLLYSGDNDNGKEFLADALGLQYLGPQRTAVKFLEWWGDSTVRWFVSPFLDTPFDVSQFSELDEPTPPFLVQGEERNNHWQATLPTPEMVHAYVWMQLMSHSTEGTMARSVPPNIPINNYGRIWLTSPLAGASRGK